ncbi:MAG: hypothetical protein HY271_01510 [Deltaproteobacteria bacterium]|nr:hypothetical protein [Deltaproteobacteria bacterium]
MIYELAATFIRPEQARLGRKLFSILRELDPFYAPGSSELLLREVLKLRTGAAVLPFLDHADQAATRIEVARLAAGTFDQRARSFIETREAEMRATHPVAMAEYVSHVGRLRARSPSKIHGIRTVDDLCGRLEPKIQRPSTNPRMKKRL